MVTTKGVLRNMTTGILHTNIGDVYLFIEKYTGEDGIMTHHLPSASRALLPILKSKLPDEWFTDEWVKEGLDEEVEVADMTEDEKNSFWVAFGENAAALWGNIKDKTVVVRVD